MGGRECRREREGVGGKERIGEIEVGKVLSEDLQNGKNFESKRNWESTEDEGEDDEK